MAQAPNPNPNGNENGDGNGNGNDMEMENPNENGDPTQLELAMQSLAALGITNLQPLTFTAQEMEATNVKDLLAWVKNNLDLESYNEFKAIRRKETKIEWLQSKLVAINEARASLLARLTGAPQQQGNENENKSGDDLSKKVEVLGKRLSEVQSLFNQVLDNKYGNGNNNNNGNKDEKKNDENLDDEAKMKMNEEIAQMMRNERVNNGSNVCPFC